MKRVCLEQLRVHKSLLSFGVRLERGAGLRTNGTVLPSGIQGADFLREKNRLFFAHRAAFFASPRSLATVSNCL